MGNCSTTATSSKTSEQIQSVMHSCILTLKDQLTSVGSNIFTSSTVPNDPSYMWEQRWILPRLVQMTNMLFVWFCLVGFLPSKTPPDICCFPHFCLLPEAAAILSSTKDQLGHRSVFCVAGVFLVLFFLFKEPLFSFMFNTVCLSRPSDLNLWKASSTGGSEMTSTGVEYVGSKHC